MPIDEVSTRLGTPRQNIHHADHQTNEVSDYGVYIDGQFVDFDHLDPASIEALFAQNVVHTQPVERQTATHTPRPRHPLYEEGIYANGVLVDPKDLPPEVRAILFDEEPIPQHKAPSEPTQSGWIAESSKKPTRPMHTQESTSQEDDILPVLLEQLNTDEGSETDATHHMTLLREGYKNSSSYSNYYSEIQDASDIRPQDLSIIKQMMEEYELEEATKFPAATETQSIFLNDLPPEILDYISTYLNKKDLLTLSLTCKQLREYWYDWFSKAPTYFNSKIITLLSNPDSRPVLHSLLRNVYASLSDYSDLRRKRNPFYINEITDLSPLCELPYLRTVTITDTYRSTSAEAEMTEVIKKLFHPETRIRSFTLQGGTVGNIVGEAMAHVLSTNKTLTFLDLSDSSFTKVENRTMVDGTGAIALGQALLNNKILKSLILSKSFILVNGHESLFNALLANKTLTAFDLSFNRVTTELAPKIAKVLADNTTLESLNLGHIFTDMDEYRVTPLPILDGLSKNKGLKFLSLAAHVFNSDEHAALLREALRLNNTLESLDLSHTDLSPECLKAIGDALTENTTLKILDLAYCHLVGHIPPEDDAISLLRPGLLQNTTLASLNLTHCMKRANSIALLCQTIPDNPNSGLKLLTFGKLKTPDQLELMKLWPNVKFAVEDYDKRGSLTGPGGRLIYSI